MTCTCSKCKGSDMHTFRVQAKSNQLNFDTSCQSRHISDKPDSKALFSHADLQLVTTNTLESWR